MASDYGPQQPGNGETAVIWVSAISRRGETREPFTVETSYVIGVALHYPALSEM